MRRSSAWLLVPFTVLSCSEADDGTSEIAPAVSSGPGVGEMPSGTEPGFQTPSPVETSPNPSVVGSPGASATGPGTPPGVAPVSPGGSQSSPLPSSGVEPQTPIAPSVSPTQPVAPGEPTVPAGTSSAPGPDTPGPGTTDLDSLEPFSFFITSLAALQALSGSPDGFGGDLRYGEADGLSGADKICAEIAERSMVGSSAKEWRAFLSTSTVDARDRIGNGPWYDRLGRVIALDLDALINQRPEGIDPEIEMDLPNEDGVPNHAPDGELVDNHDMLTGSGEDGRLFTEGGDVAAATCNDWTSAEPSGAPRVGHPWPTGMGQFGMGGFGMGFGAGGAPGGGFDFGGFGGGFPTGSIGDLSHWISALDEAGCAPGVFIVEAGPPGANGTKTVGDGGGYGGFYCFALNP